MDTRLKKNETLKIPSSFLSQLLLLHGVSSSLKFIMASKAPLRIEVGGMHINSLLCPPLSGPVRPGATDDLHLSIDRPAEGLPAGRQVGPRVHVLEHDSLVPL